MVAQPRPAVQSSVRALIRLLLARPPAAAPKWADWDANRRPRGCRSAALPLGHYLGCYEWPRCCLGPHLPLTKNPNFVYLSDCLPDCLPAGSGTDWLTVNRSSRCTAEGNRILNSARCRGINFALSPPPFCLPSDGSSERVQPLINKLKRLKEEASALTLEAAQTCERLHVPRSYPVSPPATGAASTPKAPIVFPESTASPRSPSPPPVVQQRNMMAADARPAPEVHIVTGRSLCLGIWGAVNLVVEG